MKGTIEMQASLFNDALNSYRRARQLDPASGDAALGVADAEFAADRKKESRAEFQAGMKRFPKDAQFPLHFAALLLKDAETGDPTSAARAEELLKIALRLDPASARAHTELGDLALKRGNVTEASQHFAAAIKLAPQTAEPHFGLSKAFRRMGKTEDADRETKLFQQLQETSSNSAPVQSVGPDSSNR
jgi:cytochrome c-type biogenesis protein CcmH/NrfG